MRVHRRKLRRIERVKRPQNAKFPVVIRRGIAKDGDLNFHPRKVTASAASSKTKVTGSAPNRKLLPRAAACPFLSQSAFPATETKSKQKSKRRSRCRAPPSKTDSLDETRSTARPLHARQ